MLQYILKALLEKLHNEETTYLHKAYTRLEMTHKMKNQYKAEDKMIAGDFYAATIAINPIAIRELKPYYVEVETFGNKSRSVTLIDYNNLTGRRPNAYVISAANNVLLDKTFVCFLE